MSKKKSKVIEHGSQKSEDQPKEQEPKAQPQHRVMDKRERQRRRHRKRDQKAELAKKDESKELAEKLVRQNIFKIIATTLFGSLFSTVGRGLRIAAREAADWKDFKDVFRQMVRIGALGMMGYAMEKCGLLLTAYGTILEDRMMANKDLEGPMAEYKRAMQLAEKELEVMIHADQTGRRKPESP